MRRARVAGLAALLAAATAAGAGAALAGRRLDAEATRPAAATAAPATGADLAAGARVGRGLRRQGPRLPARPGVAPARLPGTLTAPRALSLDVGHHVLFRCHLARCRYAI